MSERNVDAVVVGAGFSGLYMLYRLRELGLTTRVFEAADDVGGTWYFNRYPGARCDAPSVYYSYTFSEELHQEWEWTEKYPAQSEILRYIAFVADRFDLRKDITFETRVTAAHYDEARNRWDVTTDGGETVSARFLITAMGCLSVPKKLDIPGAEDFAGPAYMTGEWPHEGVDFTGRRVAVIGTGSSGIQAIPVIAKQAQQLTVFQRTANFSMPAYNGPLSDSERDEYKTKLEEVKIAKRTSGFGIPAPDPVHSALEVDPATREATYQAAWAEGTLVAVLSSYNDLVTNLAANDTAADFIRDKIREKVKDPATAEKLTPKGHPFGSKRPCLDSDYFETYNLPHVELVDLRETPIETITTTGIRTTEDEFEFDDIVFATGFDAMTGALAGIDIRGRDDEALADRWAEGPWTYLGLAVPGFPNMFIITGPGSPSVLSNVVVSIEQHVDFIVACLGHAQNAGADRVEATTAAADGWNAHVAEVGDMTLYPRADSWFMGANVPGKPRVLMPYAGGVGAYRQLCDEIAADGYRGFEITNVSLAATR